MVILQPSDVTLDLSKKNTAANSFIANTSGFQSFGIFPSNKYNFPEVNIYLKLGKVGFRKSRDGAFGLRHIWEKHGSELNLFCPSQVPSFIEKIITLGAEIIIDPNKNPERPLVIESKVGIVILQLKSPKNELEYFNIISAYGKKQQKGIVIAKI